MSSARCHIVNYLRKSYIGRHQVKNVLGKQTIENHSVSFLALFNANCGTSGHLPSFREEARFSRAYIPVMHPNAAALFSFVTSRTSCRTFNKVSPIQSRSSLFCAYRALVFQRANDAQFMRQDATRKHPLVVYHGTSQPSYLMIWICKAHNKFMMLRNNCYFCKAPEIKTSGKKTMTLN